MPSPDQKSQQGSDLIQQLFGVQHSETAQLAYQVSELRRDIQELRRELAPVPGLIVTGRQALDEFKRLTGKVPQ